MDFNLQHILAGCKKNDTASQKALYMQYYNLFMTMCMRYMSDKADAEEVLNNSFLRIFKHINQYKNEGSFEGWMKKIAINKAISKFKSSLLTKPLDAVIYPILDEEVVIDSDGLSLDFLLQLIQELPSQYRLVFNLYELDDFSHKEIAEMLCISEGTSKSNLHKSKVILKNKIIEATRAETNRVKLNQ